MLRVVLWHLLHKWEVGEVNMEDKKQRYTEFLLFN